MAGKYVFIGNETLAADLANETDITKGAALVGYRGRTVTDKLDDFVSSSDYATLELALAAAAGKTLWIMPGTYTITAALTPANDTRIVISGGATITTATSDINHFNASSKSNVQIYGPGLLTRSAAGSNAYYAGVNFASATDCLCFGVRMTNMQWSGVYMTSATRCHAMYNTVRNHLGTSIQDSAGIHILDNCVDCTAEFNTCDNVGWHGISVQGTGGGAAPLRSKVISNTVSNTSAYGILSYQIDPAQTYTQIIGNSIRDVTGVNPGGSGGAGIYIQSTGGVRVIGNEIHNVCTATSNNTLAPGGIGVNNITTARIRPVIEGNTITDVGITSAGAVNSNAVSLGGIYIASSLDGVVVGPNALKQFTAHTTASYFGIYINASSNITISAPDMSAPNTGNATGIFIYMNGTSLTNISISGGVINGFVQNYLRTAPAAAETMTGLTVSGLVCSGGASGINGFQFQNTNGYSIGDCQVDAGNYALYVNSCTKGSYENNRFETTGSVAIGTTGTCTGSYFGPSNYWGASAAKIENAGTGFRVEWYGATAAPAAGTWAVGDRTIRVPAVGSPKAWSCTTAGTPGTHTSEGNL